VPVAVERARRARGAFLDHRSDHVRHEIGRARSASRARRSRPRRSSRCATTQALPRDALTARTRPDSSTSTMRSAPARRRTPRRDQSQDRPALRDARSAIHSPFVDGRPRRRGCAVPARPRSRSGSARARPRSPVPIRRALPHVGREETDPPSRRSRSTPGRSMCSWSDRGAYWVSTPIGRGEWTQFERVKSMTRTCRRRSAPGGTHSPEGVEPSLFPREHEDEDRRNDGQARTSGAERPRTRTKRKCGGSIRS
jgi:hypothetical protein